MPSVARTMLCGAILVTVAYIGMCLVYVTGPVAGLVGIGAAAPARAQPSALAAQPVWQQQLAPIMQQSAVPTTAVQPAVVSMGPCCADLPSALARAVPASAPKMVLVTFCNAAFKGMLLNFAEHLRRAHIPHVIGAVDREAFELMQEAGSPTYLIDIGHVDGSSSHSGASWKKFAVTRTEEVAKVVALGYSVIMTDVDVLWLRDPIPYFVTCGAAVAEIERQSCTEIMMADVLASSDNLSPGKNLQQGLGDAYWGTFNTGIVVIRATEAGKAFAQKWHEYVEDGPGVYAGLTSDQQVFNRLVREGGNPMGIHGHWTVKRPQIVLGTLPTMFFCNGHGYFVHRIEKSYSGALPYSAHATYTYDGSSAAAKEQRFRDVGHWATPDPVEMSAGKFLAVGAGNLASLNPHGELGLGVHLQILKHQLHNLRDGLALAQALGRTLVLPQFLCFCDKVWAGHDNVFLFQHMYPGAHADGNYMPFECPVDHVLQLSAWRRSAVSYRDARFAEAQGALGNRSLTIARLAGGAPDAPGTHTPAHARTVEVPAVPLSDVTARELFGIPGSAAAEATVLRVLPSAQGLFCKFAVADAAKAFDVCFEKLIGAIEPWCSECHGQIAFARASLSDLLAVAKLYGEDFTRGGGGAGGGKEGGGAVFSLSGLQAADGSAIGASEQLSIEKVPRRADFWAEPLRSSVSLRVSVVALAKADVTGLLSPSLLFEEVPSRVWHDLSRAHAARKYSKCSDFIPPDVLALGTVHSIASRDGGQGSQFCVPFTKLLPPPLWTGSQPGGECPPVLGATSSARAGGAAPAAAA